MTAWPVERERGCGDELAALAVDRLSTTTLAEVEMVAALQTRADRKYVIPMTIAQDLVGELAGSHHLLSIDGRSSTSYGTIYFDSADWQSFRAHAQGRRRRWKIRSRRYHEDQFCRLEIKTKDDRGNTVKHAIAVPDHRFGYLPAAGRLFLRQHLEAGDFPTGVGDLLAGVRIDYVRVTLCDLRAGTRMTIDTGLVARLGGRVVRQKPDQVIVETKGGLRPASADLALRRLGARETALSKYSAALSLLQPGLPGGHRWAPLARRYFVAP